MNFLPEKCHKEMDQVYLGKLGKGDLKISRETIKIHQTTS